MGGGDDVKAHRYYDELDDEAIHVGNDTWALAVDEAGAGIKYWSCDEGRGWWIVYCSLSFDNPDYVAMMIALSFAERTPDWWLKEVIPMLLAFEPGPYDDDIDPMTKLRLAARLT